MYSFLQTDFETCSRNITITILDIIHRPVFYLKARRFGDRLALSIGPI
jgi:hypothetical protein